MKVLRESNYTYLITNYQRDRNMGLVLLAVGIFLLLSFFLGLPVLSVFGLIAIAIAWKFIKSSRSYMAGIYGEREVAEALEILDDSYCLINDVMLGDNSGNIDHVLVGPKGVFIIETKNYTGRIRCYGNHWKKRGTRRWYDIPSISRQTNGNAFRIRDLIQRRLRLKLFVRAVCVFTDSAVLDIRNPTVPVVYMHELAEFIYGIPASPWLNSQQIDIISSCILEECIQ